MTLSLWSYAMFACFAVGAYALHFYVPRLLLGTDANRVPELTWHGWLASVSDHNWLSEFRKEQASRIGIYAGAGALVAGLIVDVFHPSFAGIVGTLIGAWLVLCAFALSVLLAGKQGITPLVATAILVGISNAFAGGGFMFGAVLGAVIAAILIACVCLIGMAYYDHLEESGVDLPIYENGKINMPREYEPMEYRDPVEDSIFGSPIGFPLPFSAAGGPDWTKRSMLGLGSFRFDSPTSQYAKPQTGGVSKKSADDETGKGANL